MRIKRFEAASSSAALALVKEEMGEDAVILATKQIPGPKGGRGGTVEMVAAIDYDVDELNIPLLDRGEQVEKVAASTPTSYDYKTIRRRPVEAFNAQGEAGGARPSKEYSSPANLASSKGTMTGIQSEAHDLRRRFANILASPRSGKASAKPTGKGEIFSSSEVKSDAKGGETQPTRPNPEDVAAWRDKLISKIRFRQFEQSPDSRGGRVIALVGATGVGKTTTAAKLAAWYSLRQGLKVCLLSMDCYRIGATDQIRTYARIMRLPCEVVLRKDDLYKAIQRHADKIVIIDTAGKSPYEPQHVPELQQWFGSSPEIESHLVINAITKKEDIQHVIEVYQPLGISSMILTKLDETRAYAALCNQVVAADIPLSYLCMGQRVPEDFQIANKEFLETLFKGGENADTLFGQTT